MEEKDYDYLRRSNSSGRLNPAPCRCLDLQQLVDVQERPPLIPQLKYPNENFLWNEGEEMRTLRQVEEDHLSFKFSSDYIDVRR